MPFLGKKVLFLSGLFVSLLICGGVLMFFVLHRSVLNREVSQVDAKKVEEIRQVLRNEFDGAYEKQITPNGNVVEIKMVASESSVEIVDGVQTQVWSYNGKIPGPEIRITKGDTLKVNFTNELPQETTIHWHGVRVPHAMDGVPGVTQKPIQPGETFVYEFTPKDAGTFWFHPHVRGSEQVERGLYGTLVVEDASSKQYTQDVVWVVDDWLLTEDAQVYPQFVTPHDLMHDGRWGNIITVNGSLDEEIIARPGERIKLRMINVSNGRVYLPQFQGLNAKIVAVDGMAVSEVIDASGFTFAPGNRIDVDIQIPQQVEKNKFSIVDTFTRNTHPLGSIVVDGETVDTPDFSFLVNEQVPKWNDALTIPPDKTYRLNARQGGPNGITWTINEKAYPSFDGIEMKQGMFQKIRFENQSARLHPMHLHGQFFKVIARDGEPVSEPFFRDTVLVGPRETVDIGVVPLDKGTWAMHCHILEHADAGMMTTVHVK